MYMYIQIHSSSCRLHRSVRAELVVFVDGLVTVLHETQEDEAVNEGQSGADPMEHEGPEVILASVLRHHGRGHWLRTDRVVVKVAQGDEAHSARYAAHCLKREK